MPVLAEKIEIGQNCEAVLAILANALANLGPEAPENWPKHGSLVAIVSSSVTQITTVFSVSY